MAKRLKMVLILAAAATVLPGCRFIAPVAETLGGTGCTKTEGIIRQQGRLARKNEAFIDQYFLNYDINDPYRGDRLALDGCRN